MSTTSYYLYQKYISVDGGEPTPAYPAEYSYDGEGTMPPVVKEQYDTECGQVDTYRWVDTDDFICEESYSSQYLTIESLENGNTIYWKYDTNTGTTRSISVSTDGGQTWTEYASSSSGSGTTIATLNNGDKLLIKGQNNRYMYNSFASTKQFNVYGNIMSLVSGDTFENADTLTNIATFSRLFKDATGLVDAENLVLPATSLSSDCYEAMFLRCTSLTTAPALPATTLIFDCYYNMFYGCTSLTTAPALPATTLAYECYYGMFYGCTSLTTAPELPATTLADSCYAHMFYNCTSLTVAPVLSATTLTNYCYYAMFNCCTNLNYIKCLATDISASNCTSNWVIYVAASGTFVKASGMNDWTTGASGIPNNWTVQNA